MIVTKRSLTIWKNLFHDIKINILDAVKFTNRGIFMQNREVFIFTSKPGKIFFQNVKKIKKTISLNKRYLNMESVKKVIKDIKVSKKSKDYQEWVNMNEVDKDLDCKFDIADPEDTYKRNVAQIEKEDKECFKLSIKRFTTALEYLVTMSGKVEDLDDFEVCNAEKTISFRTVNKATGEKTHVIVTKR